MLFRSLEHDYFDGRVCEVTYENAFVVKVNRVTFDAMTRHGEVYRIGKNETTFEVL